MTRVKICGLTSESDIRLCSKAGADALGFVTEYPVPVPWNVDREKSRSLVSRVPPFVTTVAVVGGLAESIIEIARLVRPNAVQLHGDETFEDIAYICSVLSETGIKVIKALRIDVDTGKARFSETDPVKAAKKLAESGISALAVDSKTASKPAGTGVALDWSVIGKVSASIPIPLILAGGLNVENVEKAVELARPYGVDIISGVESTPGVKDPDRVRRFVRTVKRIERDTQ
jgi:phosphoribosylanthranilate isomerase